MALFDTGWVQVSSRAVTQLDLPKGRVVSAQVRWKGNAYTTTSHDTTSDSTSGSRAAEDYTGLIDVTPPSKSGWDLRRVDAKTSMSQSPSNDLYVYVRAPGESPDSYTGVGSSRTITQTSDYYPSSRTTRHGAKGWSPFNYTFTATAHWRRSISRYSQDPQITVAGATAQHVGLVGDGAVTDWYAATGFVAGAVNDVVHNATGGATYWAQIQVEYVPTLTASLQAPAAFGRATRETLTLQVVPVQPAENTATLWLPEIRASQTEDLEAPDHTWDASADQAGWEHWDAGSEAWLALPAGGAPIGAACRFTPSADMALGRWYWSARAWDDDTGAWGDLAPARQFRLVLSVVSRFACDIGGQDRSHRAHQVVISETTNGELGSMTFRLHVPVGELPPDVGAPVAMALRDAAGNEEQFDGWVSELPSRAGPELYGITCKLPDSILAERYVLADYPSQDVGLTVKAIVDTYCAPLDSSGVNTATGHVRPVTAFGRTALDVFKELREQYGLMFWVSSTAAVVHLVDPADLAASVLTVVRGGPKRT